MNSYYLDKENLRMIGKEFEKIGMVRLDGFVEENLYEELKQEVLKEKFIREKTATKFSFSKSKSSLLAREIFDSPELKFIVENIIGKKFSNVKLDLRRFSHRDYTLIHDSKLKKNKFEFLFFICENWNSKWGGNKVYVLNGKSYVFPPRGNSFILVENKKDLKGFLQYVNHLCGRNKFYLIEGFSN